jgi:ATP-dependent Lhr-like helicase
MAFRNFGLFTAEELSRFLRSEMGMREIRETLADLEADGLLAKGFLLQGSDALHWALREDIEGIGDIDFKHQFVLSPDDTLMYYLAPTIRAKFGIKMPFHVVFDGPEMVAVARTSTRGKEIAIYEFIGPREARRIMNQHIRAMGMTLREDLREEKEREWEIQEFYERTYVPDTDGDA